MEPGSPVKMIQEIRCEDEDMAKIQLVEMAKDYAKEYRHNIANIQGQPMHERLLQLISRGFPDGAVVVGKLPDNTERFLPNSCGYFLDTSENAWVVYLSHVTEPIPVSQMLYKTEEEAIAGLIKLCDGLIELNLSGGDLETFDPFPDK